MLARFAKEIASIRDFSVLFGNIDKAALKRGLILANMPLSAEEWLSFCLSCSVFLSVVFSLLAYYFTLDPLLALFLLLPFFGMQFLILLKFPGYQKHKRAEEIERELSLALRSMVIDLKLNVPFEKIFRNIAGGNYGELSREFGKMADSIEGGAAGIEEALTDLGGRVDSALFKRAVSQLKFAYEHGLDSAALPKLADELIILQKTKSREFASKTAFLGLLFIAISCIVPALFAAYVIIGSSFLSMSITPNDVLLSYLLLFPSLNLAVLLYIKEKSPKILAY